jgi:hypothetical protein
MCCFHNSDEIVQHLFFDCVLAKFIWSMIYLTFDLRPPDNIRHVFSDWVQNMKSNNKKIFFVGICVMLWAIWLNRNDIIFNKIQISSYMQVIFRGTYWTRKWSSFQKEENQYILRTACWLIETLTIEIFAKHEWWCSNRLSS